MASATPHLSLLSPSHSSPLPVCICRSFLSSHQCCHPVILSRSNCCSFCGFCTLVVALPAAFKPYRRFPGERWPSQVRRYAVLCSVWSSERSPYETLGVSWNVDEEGIKAAYRKMVKRYHPDVYDGGMELEEGETSESRFIKIQAAYELLLNNEQRRQYDNDNRVNPLKASKAWMDWVFKKKKAFEQRGDMAVTAWAEQQQREMNLKARKLSKHKLDLEEERRILFREKQASFELFETTIKRHTIVLKKRDLMRRRAEAEAQKQLLQKLLSAEGLELDEGSKQE